MSRSMKMSNTRQGGRALKQRVLELLKSADFEKELESLSHLPARQVINPLFSFLYNLDELIRWRAVIAMGEVMAKLANEDMESARVIMRRLMWSLNDESGGIGWGSPEAMGEILARNAALSEEYNRILVSYAKEDGNFQEHELMQRGVLWGIGRLSQVRPEQAKDACPYIMPYLRSPDAVARGLAAWIMGLLMVKDARQRLEHLTDDKAEIEIFLDRRFVKRRVKELAREALDKLMP
ncbi:MAG: HEAT repeat domain-containing protein [Deltaproteobacteria bacterium]|nr:HEAT repeat domain-containing protein [Deltaproteobacteria bacterium]